MNGADLLEQGADYLETHGWKQNGFGRKPGPCCALGSFRDTSDEDWDAWYAAYFALYDEVGSVPEWNDAAGQTAENVIATMRACAARLREELA